MATNWNGAEERKRVVEEGIEVTVVVEESHCSWLIRMRDVWFVGGSSDCGISLRAGSEELTSQLSSFYIRESYCREHSRKGWNVRESSSRFQQAHENAPRI